MFYIKISEVGEFKVGDRIAVESMPGHPAPIPQGSHGLIVEIKYYGKVIHSKRPHVQLVIKWDDEKCFEDLVYRHDQFTKCVKES